MVEDINILPTELSDHKILIWSTKYNKRQIQVLQPIKDKNIEKLNQYIKRIKRKYTNPIIIYNLVARKTQEIALKEMKQEGRAINKQLKKKLNKIEKLYSSLKSEDSKKEEILDKIERKENKIIKYNKRKVKKLKFSKLAKWETSSKNFFALGKRKKVNKIDISILEAEKYYTELYKSSDSNKKDRKELLNMIKPNQIKKEKLDNLNKIINITDIEKAIKEIKKGKTPGHDGITIEFYKKIPELKNILLDVYNYTFENGIPLPYNIRKVRIKILYKKKETLKILIITDQYRY